MSGHTGRRDGPGPRGIEDRLGPYPRDASSAASDRLPHHRQHSSSSSDRGRPSRGGARERGYERRRPGESAQQGTRNRSRSPDRTGERQAATEWRREPGAMKKTRDKPAAGRAMPYERKERKQPQQRQPREVVTDPAKLASRQKQIDYGKNTIGYDMYLKAWPKHKRKSGHPRTPDKYDVCSVKAFNGRLKAWRKALHQWTPKERADADVTSEVAAAVAAREEMIADNEDLDDIDAMLAELENETVAESDGGGGGSGSEATYDGTVDTSGLIDDDLLLEREDDD